MQVRDHAPLLNVADVPRSVAFYRDCLGFKLVEEYELDGQMLWAALQAGDAKLMLNRGPTERSADRRKQPSYSDLVLYLYVDDARATHRELRESGVDVTDVEQEEYGLEEFYLRDPDGYEIGVGSPLPPWVRTRE